MGFFGMVIANNLPELVGGACVLIVMLWVGIKLGRALERRSIAKARDRVQVLTANNDEKLAQEWLTKDYYNRGKK